MMDKELKILEGKTIKSLEAIKGEYGRTYNQYICIICTCGTKVIIGGGIAWKPNPDIEDMKKAPNFYSAQDIADKVLGMENNRRSREEDSKRRKLSELKRLKEELGEL